MARPEQNWITFEIDGSEVRAPEGAMLVDAAKHGDVEIPYFCYEPKLGQPVGACRMCLVEIEGIPKLQTSCSTPVRDGMVVNTTSDRVKHAQNAVVEFLLVNHPLDCPVCDKGGECPLQDISFGWGAGRSRFIEPKRHFKKPLELSPLVAIDRERCILCYRCVRFSQEVAEDHQLVFLERGDHTFVGTHDGRPYVGAVQRQHHRAVPGGRAHLDRLPLPRAAVGHRGRGHASARSARRSATSSSRCATTRRSCACSRATTRRSTTAGSATRAASATSRSRRRERITAPLVRDGGFLREVVLGARAVEAAARLERSGERAPPRCVGGQATNEEGFLRAAPAAQGPRLAARRLARRAAALGAAPARALARPDLSARVSDIDHADAILVLDTELVDEAPILDLRVRKAVRRNGARLVVASSRPSTLDGERRRRAALRARRRRGGARRAGRRARLAARARTSLDELAPRRARRAGFSPARRRERRGRRRPPTPCAPRPTSCATPATSSSSGASACSRGERGAQAGRGAARGRRRARHRRASRSPA